MRYDRPFPLKCLGIPPPKIASVCNQIYLSSCIRPQLLGFHAYDQTSCPQPTAARKALRLQLSKRPQKNDRGEDPGHEGQDRGPRQEQPTKGNTIRPALGKERKELAVRYYQLLSGRAATGACMAGKIGTIQSNDSRWCDS